MSVVATTCDSVVKMRVPSLEALAWKAEAARCGLTLSAWLKAVAALRVAVSHVERGVHDG